MSTSILPASLSPLNRPVPSDSPVCVTDDLWLAAYLVAEGGRLRGTQLAGATVTFAIEGEAIPGHEAAYARGEAVVNVARYKGAVGHLKDVLFGRLREERREPCRFPSRKSRRSSRQATSFP